MVLLTSHKLYRSIRPVEAALDKRNLAKALLTSLTIRFLDLDMRKADPGRRKGKTTVTLNNPCLWAMHNSASHVV